MLTKEAVLTKDYERLMRLIGADIIFLFGSVLSDNFREDSDIDVGIYFENRQYDKNNVCDAIIDFFRTERVDIAFLNEASPLLLFQVIKKGKPVAYKNYASLVEFQLRCLKKYWETRKFRKMKEYLLKDYVERIG
ncbi:MAG: nucleotidyltransferase domain-containing protein [Planctomycetes bacterium]|nr:nucleotidyltransferase domain-containing protein [Planctomycetota bacterium]